MKWYLKALQNYVNFKGRASRSEYWYYFLFNIIFAFATAMISNFMGSFILYLVYILGTIIPGISVAVRRLHDINKSGWYIFVGLIPFIGGIWLIVLLCTEGSHGENQYGPDPFNNMPDFDFENPETVSS